MQFLEQRRFTNHRGVLLDPWRRLLKKFNSSTLRSIKDFFFAKKDIMFQGLKTFLFIRAYRAKTIRWGILSWTVSWNPSKDHAVAWTRAACQGQYLLPYGYCSTGPDEGGVLSSQNTMPTKCWRQLTRCSGTHPWLFIWFGFCMECLVAICSIWCATLWLLLYKPR